MSRELPPYGDLLKKLFWISEGNPPPAECETCGNCKHYYICPEYGDEECLAPMPMWFKGIPPGVKAETDASTCDAWRQKEK